MELLLDKETNSLAGLFQTIVKDCKGSLPLLDSFLTNSISLQSQLHSTISCFNSFLNSLQQIADCASNTKGSSTSLGTCLTRIVIRHRVVEDHLKTLASTIMHKLCLPLQSKKEEWKKKVSQMDKEHSKLFKKGRNTLKKKKDFLVKVDKKLKKTIGDPELVLMRNDIVCSLQQESRTLHEQERNCVREISSQERNIYTTVAAGINHIFGVEFAIFREVEKLEEVMEKMKNSIFYPSHDADRCEDLTSFGNRRKQSFVFVTPPSTPGGSRMGSRSSSINSISRNSSSGESVQNLSYRSRQNSFSTQRGKLSADQKRNSTISTKSSDSGFVSQDLSLVGQEAYKQAYSKFDHSSPNPRSNNFLHSPHYKVPTSSSPVPPSLPRTVTSTPCSPSHSATPPLTSLPPLPRRPGPTIPVRRSSLSRACPAPPRSNTCPDSYDCGDDAKTPTNEDVKTPTNDQLYLPGGECDNYVSSGSSYSSGYESHYRTDTSTIDSIYSDTRTLTRVPQKPFL